ERALAAAALADEPDDLARPHLQVDAAERLHAAAAAAAHLEALAERAPCDHRVHVVPSRPSRSKRWQATRWPGPASLQPGLPCSHTPVPETGQRPANGALRSTVRRSGIEPGIDVSRRAR